MTIKLTDRAVPVKLRDRANEVQFRDRAQNVRMGYTAFDFDLILRANEYNTMQDNAGNDLGDNRDG